METWVPPGIEEDRVVEMGYGLRGCVVEVTKETARQWLEDPMLQPEHDRHLRQKSVSAFKRRMDRGEWVLSGDAIRFSEDGVRIDGQHRLRAFLNSSMETFVTLVLWELPRDAQYAIDGGSKRTMGNLLTYDGETTAEALGAAVQAVWSFNPDGDWYSNGPDSRASYAQVRTFIDTYPNIRDAVRYAATRRTECRKVGLSPRLVAGLRFEQLRRGADEAVVDEFWDGVLEGIGLGRQDARRLLRDRLERHAQNKTRGKADIGTREQVGLIAKTWVKWVNGDTVRALRFIPATEKVLPMNPGERSARGVRSAA